MKRLAILIAATFIFSIAIVVTLYAISSDIREMPGSFLRQYPPHPVVERASISIAHDTYYIAGATHHTVYLGNTRAPLHVLGIAHNLADTTHITLRLPGIEKQRFKRISVRIDSPYFYVMDGGIPYYYRGPVSRWTGINFLRDSTYFIDAVPLSSGSFAMRTTSAQTQEHVLGKKYLNASDALLVPGLLQKQIDGVFCTDGSFSYNPYLNRLVYVYYYRNQYTVMDTSLALIYRANTIDTFSHAQVHVATVASEKAVKLSAPPVITNKLHATYRQWLLVLSSLPARNENMHEFRKASVVDVYDLVTRKYQFSFYLYDRDGEKVKDLIIVNHTLFALYSHVLIRSDLTTRLFPRKAAPDS